RILVLRTPLVGWNGQDLFPGTYLPGFAHGAPPPDTRLISAVALVIPETRTSVKPRLSLKRKTVAAMISRERYSDCSRLLLTLVEKTMNTWLDKVFSKEYIGSMRVKTSITPTRELLDFIGK
ncbi:MAG: hypothetical protein JXB06_04735, partial [Spirochaetales bacterium]|nr:hypothetical protein [Spirochaetales bacterium]